MYHLRTHLTVAESKNNKEIIMDAATLLALAGVLAFAGFVVYKVKQSKNKPKNTGSSGGSSKPNKNTKLK